MLHSTPLGLLPFLSFLTLFSCSPSTRVLHTATCASICGTGDYDPHDEKKVIDNGGVLLNTCNPADLSYKCHCNNRRFPYMELWHYTVPGLMCEQAWRDCRKTNKGDEALLKECDDKIRRKCGHRRTRDQITDKERKYELWKPLGELLYPHGGHRRRGEKTGREWEA
ncbi:hypothetical protein QBC32DRAFT_328701 [Pseudoneurospora amorphoporcata]|uniref:DUF7707 domain-containing protein n=1 Tax=Pseudoneurospora amorphoporcata TaxID=241081 RepID=A0AAN6SAQ5_9PEZI|nr:hypothetical protein QBC32DRAFT_328701 [Pseudoneurospora amorphoporcata]